MFLMQLADEKVRNMNVHPLGGDHCMDDSGFGTIFVHFQLS